MTDPALPQAFAEAMARLGPFERSPRLAVAVSGGADSLALMLLADAWARERGGAILALTVDHGLRPEAAVEAQQVAAWAAARGIAHRCLTLSHPPSGRGGVQAAARAARYQALTEACREAGILHLLTGHHRDDQAETVLLRLQRGSGIAGLSGIAAVQNFTHLRLLRPLLGVSKAALIGFCAAARLVPLQDPGNVSGDFTRVRLRRAMAAAPDLFPVNRLAETAEHMAAARASETAAADLWLTRWLTPWPLGIARFPVVALGRDQAAGRETALARLCAWAGGALYPPRFGSIAELPDRLHRQDRLTLGGVLWVRRREIIWLGREAAALAPPDAVPDDGSACRWDGRFTATAQIPGWTLGGLGGAAAARLRQTPGFRHPEGRLQADLARAPAAILAGMPAFQSLDGTLLVPHLSEMPGNAPRLQHTPRRPLTAEGERGS